LKKPRIGAANTALRRLLPAEYENGFSTPRGWNKSQSYNGFMLPNPRDVSTHIISTKTITNDNEFTLMLMQWGQFLDHDLDHTAQAMSLNTFSNGIACRDSCTNEQPCFPIEVLQNDTMRSHMPGKCMEFIRSSAICGSGETSLLTNKVHQREQINQLTAYIDASNVYGSNDQDAFDIRERVVNSGKLKTHVTSKYPKGLLPFNLDTNMDCQRDNTSTVGCFLAGDYRANEQLALLAMHNLWVRQHNTLVEKLKKINPYWSPEQLFQEARKIVGAQMQVITFEHWLPHILGPVGMEMLGTYKGYDENVDPTILNEFATAAFRFGHALIQPFTFRLNESLQPIEEGNILLRDSFFAPQRYYHEGGMEPLLRGLYGIPAKLKQPREIMNSELTEKLFHITRFVSLDLAALNIQVILDYLF
jgi:peroxidase